MGNHVGIVLRIMFLFGLGTGSAMSSEIQLQGGDSTRLVRSIYNECSPYNASICSSVLGTGSINTLGSSYRKEEYLLLLFQQYQQFLFNRDPTCHQLIFAITCMSFYPPCGTHAWCTTVNSNVLEAILNDSCTCRGEESQCAILQTSLLRVMRTAIHQDIQVPLQKQCNHVSFDGIAVPTTPAFECAPYNEVGSVCNSVFGAGKVVTSRNISESDNQVLAHLEILRRYAPSLDPRCLQLYYALWCMRQHVPCGYNAWCTTANRSELEAMVNATCPCPNPKYESEKELCAIVQDGLLLLVRFLQLENLHQFNQTPSQAHCNRVNIDGISVPTATTPPPPTPPTTFIPGFSLPPCSLYNGSVCSAVFDGQLVRSRDYRVSEFSVQDVINQAERLARAGSTLITNECRKAILDVACISNYQACANKYWCSSTGADELAAMLNNSCGCPKPVSQECEASISSDLAAYVQTAMALERVGYLYQPDQLPLGVLQGQCQTLSLGVQPTSTSALMPTPAFITTTTTTSTSSSPNPVSPEETSLASCNSTISGISSPERAYLRSEGYVMFNWTSKGNVEETLCRLDGGAEFPCQSGLRFNVSAVTAGTHRGEVIAYCQGKPIGREVLRFRAQSGIPSDPDNCARLLVSDHVATYNRSASTVTVEFSTNVPSTCVCKLPAVQRVIRPCSSGNVFASMPDLAAMLGRDRTTAKVVVNCKADDCGTKYTVPVYFNVR